MTLMMSEFFSLKIRWRRVVALVLGLAIAVPYLFSALPSGGASEQAWLDQVIERVEDLRENTEDPEVREVLDYTLERYRTIGPYNVQVRSCGPWALGLNVPYCPGVFIDPECLQSPDLGMVVLVHEAQHDYFPYAGHKHFRIFQ